MVTVAQIWRHPIKSHGRELLESTPLTKGKCMPWDRHWAVTHEASKFDGTNWVMCRNFMIGTMTPSLAGLWAKLDEATGNITLRHIDLGELTFNPDTEDAAFIEWITPICPPERNQPKAIVAAEDRGMTDTDYPTVSIMNLASHADVAARMGAPLELERWRGNIWLDGLGAWDEFNWIDKTVRIGGAKLRIRERIERCMHTAANPGTGVRDADTLGTLKNNWGHQDFGVYAEVVDTGDIALGDTVEVL